MYNERILVKTASVALSDEPAKVDAEGLEVTVRAGDSDVLLLANANDSDNDAFPITAGTSVTLRGTFYLKAQEGSARLLYCKLL